MSSGGGSRDDNKILIVAGVVIGAGILAVLYKMFFSGPKEKPGQSHQVGAPWTCTCLKGGKNPDGSGSLALIVAGVVIGAGVLAVSYKMFFSPKKETSEIDLRCRPNKIVPICLPLEEPETKGSGSVPGSEERDRRARARERRLRLYGSEDGEGEGFYGPDGELLLGPNGELVGPDGTPLLGPNGEIMYGPNGPKKHWSPLQIVLGSVSFLCALVALIVKTVDHDTLHAVLSKVGLGHLIPKSVKPGCLDPNKRKWPPLPPKQPPDPPQQKPKKKC